MFYILGLDKSITTCINYYNILQSMNYLQPLQPLIFLLLLLLNRFSRVQLCATHRRQPTRLCRPWDSPGKNTGVGCHFLLQCMKMKSESDVTQSCPTLSDPMDCSLLGSSVHGIFQARVLEWGAIAFSANLFMSPYFAFSRVLYCQNHRVCSLFRVASFI